MEHQRDQLVRGLTLTDTTALVVGTVIGTGVFIKSAIMAQDAGSPLLVLTAWVAAGLLSLAGALSYAELGAMLPHVLIEGLVMQRIVTPELVPDEVFYAAFDALVKKK